MLGVVPRLAGRRREGLQAGQPPQPLTGASPTRAYFVDAAGQPLAVDLRSDTTARQEWNYVVETAAEAPGDVMLTWPELGQTGVRDVSFILVDLTTGTRRYMRTTTHYSYRATRGGNQRRFRIIAERGATNSPQITSFQAQPTRGGEVQLTFTLSQAAETAICVRTLSGREVAQVEVGRPRAVGLNTAAWDGRDSQGRPLPAGMYLVEVMAADEEGRQASAVRAVTLGR